MTLPPPPISATGRGRRRAAGRVAHRPGASLSGAADPAGGSVPAGRRVRRGRPPWADKIKPLLGTIVVENIGRRRLSLGAAAVARARPDGYTILLGGTQTHVNEALLKSKPLYDPVKDLDPIASVARLFPRHRRASIGAGADPEGAGRLCEGQSRQAVLRALPVLARSSI